MWFTLTAPANESPNIARFSPQPQTAVIAAINTLAIAKRRMGHASGESAIPGLRAAVGPTISNHVQARMCKVIAHWITNHLGCSLEIAMAKLIRANAQRNAR